LPTRERNAFAVDSALSDQRESAWSGGPRCVAVVVVTQLSPDCGLSLPDD
jgi:hypothetical protein